MKLIKAHFATLYIYVLCNTFTSLQSIVESDSWFSFCSFKDEILSSPLSKLFVMLCSLLCRDDIGLVRSYSGSSHLTLLSAILAFYFSDTYVCFVQMVKYHVIMSVGGFDGLKCVGFRIYDNVLLLE